jgi:hypothetical protein
VGGARDAALYGAFDLGPGYAFSAAGSLVFFLFCWRLFYLSEYRVAERL